MSDKILNRLDLIQVDQSGPKYDWLKRYLRSELEAGRIQPGQALPSEPKLAASLQISRSTVRQALADLERDGMIRRVRGKGTFVRETFGEKQNNSLAAYGLVLPASQGGFYPSLLHGFETEAKQTRHQMIVSSTNNDLKQQESILLQLLEKKVAGVAIVPATVPLTPAYQVRRLQEAGTPVVFCHRPVGGVSAPLLALPYHKIGRTAGRAFVKYGHRRAAYIATHRAPSTEDYARGLQEAMREGGGDLPSELTCYCNPPDPSARNEKAVAVILKQILDLPDPPTAIMTPFDSVAEIVYMQLIGMGLRIPEDVSLVGVGGKWRQGAIVRRLSSVTIDEVKVGRQAAELLYEMQSGRRAIDDTERILVEPGFADGETLGEVPKSDQMWREKLRTISEARGTEAWIDT